MFESNQTSLDDELSHTHWAQWTFTTLFGIIFLAGIAANLVVIIVLVKKRELKQFASYFFINLSLADMLVLILCVPISISDLFTLNGVWLYGAAYCKIYTFFEYCFTSVSSFTIISISLERLVALRKPLALKRLFSRKHSLIMISIIWTFSIIISFPFIIHLDYSPSERQCFTRVTKFFFFYTIVFYSVLIFVPTIGLTVLYTYILIQLRSKFHSIQKNHQTTAPRLCTEPLISSQIHFVSKYKKGSADPKMSFTESECSMNKRNTTREAITAVKNSSGPIEKCSFRQKSKLYHSTMIIILVASSFFFGQIPIRVFMLWSALWSSSNSAYNLSESAVLKLNLIDNLTTMIFFIHCLLNPVIYNLVSDRFRRAFIDMITRKKT